MYGVGVELKRGVKDIFSLDVKALGRKVLPIAVVAAAGVAGLSVRKQQNPPSADLIGRTSVPCGPLGGDGAPAGLREVQRDLRDAAGADWNALGRAARRLRAPLERDIIAAALAAEGAQASSGSSAQLCARLVKDWRAAGYCDEPIDRRDVPEGKGRGWDTVTKVDESYGRDLGSEAPLCLLRNENDPECASGELRGLAPTEWKSAAETLERDGVVNLRGLLSTEGVQAMRKRLGVHVSMLDMPQTLGHAAASAAVLPPVRQYEECALQGEDPDLYSITSTVGRRHFTLRGRVLEDAVRDVQAGALPLIWEHLASNASGTDICRKQFFISEVQLLVTDPCAVDVFWHVDNPTRGVTLFVPLTQVPADLGPTLFLPGTHKLHEGSLSLPSRVSQCASSLLSSDGVAMVTMEAGDALIYDSRLIHRGAANMRYQRTSVALIFRYDFERPPGYAIIGTSLIAWAGNCLAAIQRVYGALPSPASSPSAAAAK